MENLIHKYKDGQRKMKWSSFQLFSLLCDPAPTNAPVVDEAVLAVLG
jgi:hypothetical protein